MSSMVRMGTTSLCQRLTCGAGFVMALAATTVRVKTVPS